MMISLQVNPSAISDHCPIIFQLPWKRPLAPRREIHLRKYKDIDLAVFSEDIKNSALTQDLPDDASELALLYDRTLSNILDKHAPETVKSILMRYDSPWYTDEIHQAKRERRQAERRWWKSKLCIDHQIYRDKHCTVVKLCVDAKIKYFCSKIHDCEGDHAKLFKVASGLLHRRREMHLPTHTDPKDIADRFVHYFSNKIEKIRIELNAQNENRPPIHTPADLPEPPVFNHFTPISEQTLQRIIMGGNSKSCRLDPMPTYLLKATLPILLPTLCAIVNTSLAQGIMPDSLKTAAVAPLLKKLGLDIENFKNFRPISNLPYLGKLIEKVAVSQMEDHMTEHNLHEIFQSAYQANHSTETALLRVSNDVLRAADRRQCTLLTMLDLSAAFDTINHNQFLDRLEAEFGVKGHARRWLESYFRDRTQAVYIDSTSSVTVPLDVGFPQGSVIGPFGFKPFTKPLSAIAKKHGVGIHLYADDTQLYVSCDPDNVNSSLVRLEACIEDIRDWMCRNNLKLNDSKTEFLTLGAKAQLSKIGDMSIRIGGENIPASHSAKNIGVVFDSTMEMVAQVNQITKSCYLHLRAISNIRKYLTNDAAEKLVHAFVTSRLDCNNALLYGIADYLIDKLQLIQNNAARVISQKRKHDHITPTLISLHWLPVHYRIQYKLLLLTFKSQNNKAPVYLADLLEPYIPIRALRSDTQERLVQPKTRTKKYGDRAFSTCGPKLWNELPQNIKCAETVDTFKSLLKTYMFKLAFDL